MVSPVARSMATTLRLIPMKIAFMTTALLLLGCGERHRFAVGEDAAHEHATGRTVAHRADRERDLVARLERVLRPAASRKIVRAHPLDAPRHRLAAFLDVDPDPRVWVGPLEAIDSPRDGLLGLRVERRERVVRDEPRAAGEQHR